MIWLTDFLQETCNRVFSFIPYSRPTKAQIDKVIVVAHRGAWKETGLSENSLEAFRRCLNTSVGAIEFDIRWTADDLPVIHHDPSTERVFTKSLSISELSFEELRKEIPQIPLLSEVVSELGGHLLFMIELKTKATENQVSRLKEILKPLGPCEDYYFMSLKESHFTPLGDWSSKTMVSIARTNIQEMYHKTLKNNWGGLTGQFLLLRDSMKKQCHQHKILTGTGFPDSKSVFYREVSRDVDWIFTNHPLELASLKEI